MALNFNVSPYYDDFDPNKNFHRILFKPGFAVQARELTQSQTILQNQVSKFADHIFQKNTPISGGKVTLNITCSYLKLTRTYNGTPVDIDQFKDKLIQNQTGDVIAKVIAVIPATSTTDEGDPPTLIVSYLSGNVFGQNDVLFSVFNSNLAAQLVPSDATGLSSTASISEGVFYVVNGYSISQTTQSKYTTGHFVNVQPQTIPLDKYNNAPNVRVGLNITETIFDFIDDVSLLDPANGSPNYQAPGADRYVIKLSLETRPLTLGDDDGFIELVRIKDGQIQTQVNGTVYSAIDDYFAKRTYEESGDYIVNDFKITPVANTVAPDFNYDIRIGKGIAYVQGYRLENQSEITLVAEKSTDTANVNNNLTYVEYGNYLFTDSANGVIDSSEFPLVDLHCVKSSNVAGSSFDAYNSTLVGTARIRAMEFQYPSNGYEEVPGYVYRTYLADINTVKLSSNANTDIASTSNTISFYGTAFSSSNGAYNGVTIQITGGPSFGDVKKIIDYNGITKTATVDSPWTQAPTSNTMFSLNFDITDANSIVRLTNLTGPVFSFSTNVNETLGKNSVGDTVIYNPSSSKELIYPLGSSFVSDVLDTSYQTTKTFTNVEFSDTQAIINLGSAPMQFLSTVPDDYIIMDNDSGTFACLANVSSISLTNSNKTATITVPSGSLMSSINATIVARVAVTDASNFGFILKIKNLVKGNSTVVATDSQRVAAGGLANSNTYVSLTSGQTWIQANGFSALTPHSLYVSDVKRIVKIIDTKALDVSPTSAMLTNSTYDVTSNFKLDNGQRDSYYDHATISLIPGRPNPKGDLLVCYEYYDQSTASGDGYFSVKSYLAPLSSSPEAYADIPTYVSTSGRVYSLRDCLDFRPVRRSGTSDFVFVHNNDNSLLPSDSTSFTSDYFYYLARKDKLVLTKENVFKIIKGIPAVVPQLPTTPDGSLLLANISLDPYTAYIPGASPLAVLPSVTFEKVQHRRWTMSDISGLNSRVNNIEYYTALNALEKNAQSLQVPDVNGLNRFKNGILVDDFSGFGTADTKNPDFNASINKRTRMLMPSTTVDNFQLQSQYLLGAYNSVSDSSSTYIGFKVNKVGKTNIFTLPYTSSIVASQTLASNTLNLNPFSTVLYNGEMTLNPPMDNWVDNTKQPDLLIVDPNLSFYQSSDSLNILSAGDWKTVPGTSSTTATTVTTTINQSTGATTTTTTDTTTTYTPQVKNTTLGYYDNLGSSFSLTNGFITDISILPYIRPQQVKFRAKGLLINTPLKAWFDGVDVSDYITSPDVIELSNVSGTFKEEDVVGYFDNNIFYPVATVLSVVSTSNRVRLYVSGNKDTLYKSRSAITTLQNATFSTSGNYVGFTARGTIATPTTGNTVNEIISLHKTGVITSAGGSFNDSSSPAVKVKYYRIRSSTNKFARKFAVWGNPRGKNGKDIAGTAFSTGTFNFRVPTTGTYYLRYSAGNDVTGNISVNGNILVSSLTSDDATHDTTVVLTAGTANVTIAASSTQASSSSNNDNYIAVAISPVSWPVAGSGDLPNHDVVFATNDLYVSTPDMVSSNTALTGGGRLLTGVRELSLSGIANTVNDFYKDTTIKLLTFEFGESKFYRANVTGYTGSNSTIYLDSPVNVSVGFNRILGTDISSTYTIEGTANNYLVATSINTPNYVNKLSSDETGEAVGIFNIPAGVFRTGTRVFRLDNRLIDADPLSSTTFAEASFTASGLATKSQSVDFSPSIDSAKNIFTETEKKIDTTVTTSTTTSTTGGTTTTRPPVTIGPTVPPQETTTPAPVTTTTTTRAPTTTTTPYVPPTQTPSPTPAAPGSQIWTSGSGNWTVPAGVTVVYGTIVGGGAGGSSGSEANPFTTGGGGGGSGGIKTFTMRVTPGQSIPYVVGAGGVGTTVNSALGYKGGPGGTTSFGIESIAGGKPATTALTFTYQSFASYIDQVTGNFTTSTATVSGQHYPKGGLAGPGGQNGFNGQAVVGDGSWQRGGAGGSCGNFGVGGAGGTSTSSNGKVGSGYGAGGGGGAQRGGSGTLIAGRGAAGQGGYIKIEW